MKFIRELHELTTHVNIPTIISLDAWYRYSIEKLKDVNMKIKTQVVDPYDYINNQGDFKIKETVPQVDYSFFDDDIVETQKYIEPFVVIPQENVRYSIINIIAYCLGKIVNDYMHRYAIAANSCRPEADRKCLLIMKNEFLFKRVLVEARAKKRYASKMELQEGNIVPEEESLDIKGMDIRKSTVNAYTKQRIEKILYEDILNADNIDLVHILKQLAIFEKDIFNSLKNGEKNYCKPVRVKAMSAYADPMRVTGIKQSVVWNALKDDNMPMIDLDQRNDIDILKLNINKKNVELIKDTNPEAYMKCINLMKESHFVKGIDAIAIPRDCIIPEWLVEFIDYNTIINNNLSIFPLESLGIYRGNKNNNYTNIVSL